MHLAVCSQYRGRREKGKTKEKKKRKKKAVLKKQPRRKKKGERGSIGQGHKDREERK